MYSPVTLDPLATTVNTVAPPFAVTVGSVTGLLDVIVTVMISPTVACVESTALLLVMQYVIEGNTSDVVGDSDALADRDGAKLTDDDALALKDPDNDTDGTVLVLTLSNGDDVSVSVIEEVSVTLGDISIEALPDCVDDVDTLGVTLTIVSEQLDKPF